MSEITWIEGRIARVRYRSADGAFAVLKVEQPQGEVVVVGPVGGAVDLHDGGDSPFVSFEGGFETHASHGHRFKATAWLVGSPQTDAGLRHYLSTSAIPGVGPSIATNIVAHFGRETTTVLERAPERLAEVPGIGAKRAAAITAAWKADAGVRALSIKLRSLGLSAAVERRIRERFGEEAFDVITRQPYRLITEIRGVGFATADRLALAQGVAPDDPQRAEAAVVHVLSRSRDEGHCVLPVSSLRDGVTRLRVPLQVAEAAVPRCVDAGLVREVALEGPDRVALPTLAAAEEEIVDHLFARLRGAEVLEVRDDELTAAATYVGLGLDDGQRQAVQLAASQPLTVITGGPGTGKTTLVKVLLRVALERGETWLLASPTGRAARRLQEASGQEASTLHRLLGFDPGAGQFTKDATEPLDADGLVVDEASMIDVELLCSVLRACPTDRPFRLVLVGDADQLPSVGPGQVLRDLLASGQVPAARLQTVHRQAAQSGIVVAANAVLAGEVPASGEDAGFDDVFLVHRQDAERAAATLVKVVAERLPAKGFSARTEVQVLTPTRRGPLGAERLNAMLQAAINPASTKDSTPALSMGKRRFVLHDRILCVRNRYDHGVFNGDLGVITAVGKDSLTVDFDGRVVAWARDDLSDLDLAYAITVHKSQGSEYPAVVLAFHRSHSVMLRRNLFYTALTRAKRFVCVVGDGPSWHRAVERADTDRRHTTLVQRAREAFAPVDLGSPAAAERG